MEMAMTKVMTMRDKMVKATMMRDKVVMTVRDEVVMTVRDEVVMTVRDEVVKATKMMMTMNVTQDLSDLMMTTVI
jgi:hypothetical protein